MYQIQNTFLARALRCFKSCLKRLESRDILSINIIVHWQHSNYKPASSGLISYDKTRRRFDERPSWQKVQTMFFINPTIALKRACSSPSAGNAKRHTCICSRVSSQRERGRKWICLIVTQLWGVYDVHYVLDIQIYLSLLCMDVGNVNFLLYVTSSSRQNSLPDFDFISTFKFKWNAVCYSYREMIML